MSARRPKAAGQLKLRRRLEAILQPHGLDGSLLLLALGAVWLAVPEGIAESTLGSVFYDLATAEGLDGDELATQVVNLGVAS